MTTNRKARRKQRAIDREVLHRKMRAAAGPQAEEMRPIETTFVDKRIACGARCTWWDGIANVGLTPPTSTGNRLPCCPNCRRMLFEYSDEQAWFESVDRHEARGNPGYRKFVEWLRGKCFDTVTDAVNAYAEETGIVMGGSVGK